MGIIKKVKDTQFKVSGQLKSYLSWPIYVGMLFLVMTIPMYIIDLYAGFLMTGFDAVYFVIAILLFAYKHNSIMASMIDFAANYSQVQKGLLKDFLFPIFDKH